MVRQWQDLFYGKRYSHTVLNDQVDFVKLAEAMGAKGCLLYTSGPFGRGRRRRGKFPLVSGRSEFKTGSRTSGDQKGAESLF